MPQKIHRKSPSLFRKRRRVLKTIGTILVAAVLVTGGYFGAAYLFDQARLATETSSAGVSDASADSTPAPTSTPGSDVSDDVSDTPDPTPTAQVTRAVYVPLATLRDRAALDDLITQAERCGMNAVLFDLKDETGVLWYASATPLARQSQAAADNALTTAELRELLTYVKDKGFTAIARLYAFRDHTAPHTLPEAKIGLEGQPGWTWLDNSFDQGGKPWLNPYAPQAHEYLTAMATELAGLGLPAILLDGVQFPFQTSQAYYGTSELTSLSWPEVLSRFVADFTQAAGDDCVVMQSMPGLSVIGDQTEPFGGNPATFGAAVIAPVLMPSTLGSRLSADGTTLTDLTAQPYETMHLAANQVQLRLALMAEADRPEVMPWIQAEGYEPAQIEQQIQALTEVYGADASYIVYDPAGAYRWW